MSIDLYIARDADTSSSISIDLSKGPPSEIKARTDAFGNLTFSGEDVFDALVALRLFLESEGYRLLCAAARKDTYPSRMIREMALGCKVYVFRPGKQALRADLIDVFDVATYDEVGTVEEQSANYKAWLESLR